MARPSIKEKPLVAVTTMYNNQEWVLKNLSTIFAQQYSNFRVIIVDDASTDDTAGRIEQYLTEHNLWNRVTFIKNETRKRKLFNLYRVLYMVDDQEIAVLVDGDDWLADTDVFFYINMLYENDIWFTYGQYENVPEYQATAWGFSAKGYARPVPEDIKKNHSYRRGPFYYMQLRTFRGWLFKLVKLRDLISETVEGFVGEFFPASNDLAMYYPMIEMSHEHIHFVDKIIYKRNLYSPIVGFKVDRAIQCAAAIEIKKRSSYDTLQSPIYRKLEKIKQSKIDRIIWLEKNSTLSSDLLKQCIKSVGEGEKNVVLYHASTDKKIIQKLQNNFPQVIFFKCTSLQDGIAQCTQKLGNKYIFVQCDLQAVVPGSDMLCAVLYQLERTYAAAVCFIQNAGVLDKNSMPIAQIDDNFYASKLCFYDQLVLPSGAIKGFLVRVQDVKIGSNFCSTVLFNAINVSHQTVDDVILFTHG
jgi:glycosyltransferase involved in cell wall biosynthesis